MAEKFITYTKHGVLEVSSMVATNGGKHIMNAVCDVELDNGSVCKLGDYVEFDYFKAEIPAVTDEILIVATEPKIYAEYTKKMQEESNFFNGVGELVQLNDVERLDRIALSKEAFDASAEPAVGQYVGVTGTGYKLTTLGAEEPTGRGFVGYIYDVATNGNYRVLVKRNLAV